MIPFAYQAAAVAHQRLINDSGSPSWTQLQIEAVKPTNLTAVWVNDYVQIDFTDNSGGLVQHEIVEANGVGSYSVVTILAKGVTNYHNYT